jgi:GNAT superfamily N-acetyltransferase
MSAATEIVVLDARAVEAVADQLADVLVDCVEGGASVSFMAPLSHRQAFAFFWTTATAVADDKAVVLAARRDGRIVGTVQLDLDTPPNQPHRAEVKKLLVHRGARNLGIGAQLMRRIEQEAKARRRWLLMLDTASVEAERLYAREGWTRLGRIPDYALLPQGDLCDTTLFWKRLTL